MSFYRTTGKSGATKRSSSLNKGIAGMAISDSESMISIDTFANSEDSANSDEVPSTKEELAYFRLSLIDVGEGNFIKAVRITSHILIRVTYSVWFTVEWNDGEESWEPESALQGYQPEMVYAYWGAQKGGRDEVTQFDMYHVFAILDHGSMVDNGRRRAKKIIYKIHWVGYDESDNSWETSMKVAGLVPQMKQEYDEKHGL
ncbi:uncharacterized protein BKA55DRAFT_530298 [Fusarium redolens]|uniref:Chromo domain-containing protein n=1 Tax=Fusarium redolens TaxID=48865 RepID=A0A9P9JP81_FUSRE|nr:uncharacterized protein BKA55DRAFT_530298 [Fusarium redolens]KAH7205818.1 hypothetical protein BKA55DRAFT_530298 [Fusarium redolens]